MCLAWPDFKGPTTANPWGLCWSMLIFSQISHGLYFFPCHMSFRWFLEISVMRDHESYWHMSCLVTWLTSVKFCSSPVANRTNLHLLDVGMPLLMKKSLQWHSVFPSLNKWCHVLSCQQIRGHQPNCCSQRCPTLLQTVRKKKPQKNSRPLAHHSGWRPNTPPSVPTWKFCWGRIKCPPAVDDTWKQEVFRQRYQPTKTSHSPNIP